ncbi:MAG: DJ-1 family glyoxalase III [Opitutales bacterium]
MTRTALIILYPGFEEMEAVAPIDLLARAGVDVTQASLGDATLVPGRNGMTLKADCPLSELSDKLLFDAIILPGGPGINNLRAHKEVCQRLQQHHTAGKLVAAICAAPLLLLDAGLIDHLGYTAHPTAANELPNQLDEAFVFEGNILTSRGAGTATEFALTLVERLTNKETRLDVAGSICWRHD